MSRSLMVKVTEALLRMGTRRVWTRKCSTCRSPVGVRCRTDARDHTTSIRSTDNVAQAWKLPYAAIDLSRKSDYFISAYLMMSIDHTTPICTTMEATLSVVAFNCGYT